MKPARPAGYSGTPLARKLGIGPGAVVCVLEAPANYRELLAPLPEGVRFVPKVSAAAGVVHAFAVKREKLEAILRDCRGAIAADAAVWVSWPKKAAKVPTDITEDAIRESALPLGFVDVKVCAVDETWSGLKLVIRKELR